MASSLWLALGLGGLGLAAVIYILWLRSRVSGLQANITTLNTTVVAMKNQASELNQELRKANLVIDDLHQDITNLQSMAVNSIGPDDLRRAIARLLSGPSGGNKASPTLPTIPTSKPSDPVK